ncbi:ABC transporter ATP-binding protein [Smaragdicoccus niigatensis]|uniref:ABC transporter ATP-binding protein n=1 Tax=Smaragdicoccus niigatensis TaxID=359359 RepID=UPI00037A4558|nr:ABC transporter ATP-binding protein [Smaragdicoccus niigatensis]
MDGWRTLPRNTRTAVRLVRQAAPREYAVHVATSVASGIALLLVLLSGRELLIRLAPASELPRVSALVPVVLLLGAAALISTWASAIQTSRETILSQLVVRRATDRIIDASTAVPLAEFESPDFQDHLRRSLDQSSYRPWEVAQAVGQLAAALAGAGAVAVVLLGVMPILVPVIAIAGIPLFIAATRNSRTLFQAYQSVTPIARERIYLESVLTGRREAPEIRTFRSQNHLKQRYAACYDREIDALRHAGRIRARRTIIAGTAFAVVSVAVLLLLVILTANAKVSLADAAVAGVAVQQLASRVRGVNGAITAIQENAVFLTDYEEFLDRTRRAGAVPRQPVTQAGNAGLDDVWFTYPGASQPALKGVDIDIRPGEFTALVGPNGSGKSTVAKLICGLYEPQSGSIHRTSDVGAVFQDFVRYDMSAAENIGLGNPDRMSDRSAVVASAAAASADGFIADLPRGFDTRLSPAYEGGVDLSIGQWQRLAIARALFSDATLLVLDEPTASMDPIDEHELMDNSTGAFAGRTVLLISHRFSNVMRADRIYVLDEGRVIEHGTHADLMARGGAYACMFDVQAATYSEAVR